MTAKTSIFSARSGNARRVRRWEKAGIISGDQGSAILAFERDKQGKRFIRNLVSLALLAIALGVLSIVAANWAEIPSGVKIGAHFMLNIAAAAVMYGAARKNNNVWREGAAFLFFALNLTMIALIGQVFQLDGNYATALSVWVAISTPAVFMYGRTVMNAVPWILAALAALCFNMVEIVEYLDDTSGFLVILGIGLVVPLLFLAAGMNDRLREARSHWSISAFYTGIVILAVQATIASLFWYVDTGEGLREILEKSGSFSANYILMLLTCALPFALVMTVARLKTGGQPYDRSGVLFVLVSLASTVLPLVLMTPEIHFLSAVHFIAYWTFLGWVGYRIGYERLVSNAVTLIAIRIIFVYIELFNNLMETGYLLLGGGVLTLVIFHTAKKLRSKIAKQNTEGDSHDIPLH